jgi:methanogen homoisocitrate dehydrogenase
MHKICIIKGDGVGVEVIEESLKVIEKLKLNFEITEAEAGFGAFKKYQTPLPEETLEKCKQSEAILFGAVTTPPNIKNYFSPIVRLRKELDLFANLRPCQALPIPGVIKNTDLIIIRENTEGLYAGLEKGDDSRAVTKRVITKKASQKIVRFAFKLAKKQKRKKITVVHKANVMRLTDGLFLKAAREVANNYKNLKIEYEEALVDSLAYRLVKNPKDFDVIVTTNMFGDILSDLSAAFVGGLGVVPSANIGKNTGLFEPVHGSAPDIAGKGVVNPIATFLSLKLMLDFLKLNKEASKLQKAIELTLKNKIYTADLGEKFKTSEVTEAVMGRL